MHIPIIFVIFQLNTKMDKNTRQSIINKIATEHTIPSAETDTGLSFISVNKSQGSGKLKQKFYWLSISLLVNYIATTYDNDIWYRVYVSLPNCYIKYIGAHRRGDCHISEPFSRYNYTRDQIWYRCSSS